MCLIMLCPEKLLGAPPLEVFKSRLGGVSSVFLRGKMVLWQWKDGALAVVSPTHRKMLGNDSGIKSLEVEQASSTTS